MKYIKLLGLLAVTAAALMAFAGTASATLRSTTSGAALSNGTTIAGTDGVIKLTGSWSDVTCHSQFSGELTTNDANHAGWTIPKLDFSLCSDEVTVEAGGSFTLENTTLKWLNAAITVHTSVGECKLSTGSGVTIGTLEDSHTSKGLTAKLNINNSKIPVTGSFFCGSTAEWEGYYTVNTPFTLYED